LVGDQVNGALFEAGNVEELSRKLVHLVTGFRGRKKMAAASARNLDDGLGEL